MKYKGKSDQHKFYLDNEGSFQLISDLEKNDALFEALIEGDPTLTEITSQHKIDLDILHQHKKTIRRSSGSIYGLIQDHPDQNAKLLFAIQHNDLELVDIAFKNGASIKVLTENKDILRYVANNENLIDYFQNKHLFTSVEKPNSNLDVLKQELSDFWKAKDGNGNTLLHLACQQGNEAVITQLLIAEDIDIGIKNREGKIALELIENKDLKSSICQMALTLQSTIQYDSAVKSKLDSETLLTINNILKSITDPGTNISLTLNSDRLFETTTPFMDYELR
jgi:ankyrin repeat protein